MIGLTFTDNVTKKLSNIAEKLGTVISGGVNEAGSQAIDLTEQNVRDMIAIDQMEIRSAFSRRDSSVANMECQVQIDARHTTDLNAFAIRQTNQGVEVKVYRFQPPVLYLDTFGPNQKRLPKGIYRRISRSRFPIERIKSIQIFGEEPVKKKIKEQQPKIRELAMTSLDKNVSNLIKSS
jgi:hypothetical protein